MALPAFIAPVIASLVDGVLDKIPNVNDRAKAKEDLEQELLGIVSIATRGQLEINKQEAAHKSIFVAGWRPFIGWVCGVGIAWQFVVIPILNWVILLLVINNPELEGIPNLPALDMAELMGLVFALLGMGGLRSFEKSRGVARSS